MKNLVYYVDDNKSILELIKVTLDANGFDSFGFFEPDSFLQKMESIKPDLILLDITFPNCSGYDVLEKLKNDSRFQNIPVIIVSGRTLESDIVKGLDMGASDYIKKPFGTKELVARIKANIRKTEMYQGKIYRIRDLMLDENRHLFTVKDVPVELGNKEFDIMTLLMSSPSIVVNRNVFFKKAWGIDYEIETRTLDMHIKFIRKKIAEITDEKYIETIRSVGYVIRE